MNIFDDFPNAKSRTSLLSVLSTIQPPPAQDEIKERAAVARSATTSLVSAILSQELLANVSQISSEEEMIAIAKLVVTVGLRAIKAFQQKKYVEFDALTADFGCERVAYQVYTLASSTVFKAEAQELLKVLEEANKELGNRPGKIRVGKAVPAAAADFFRTRIANMVFSQEMALLFQMYALTAVKLAVTDASGQVTEKTDVSKIQTFSSKLPGRYLTSIVAQMQARVSAQLVVFMRGEVENIRIMGDEERALLRTMLEPSMIKTNEAASIPLEIAKSYVCSLYSIKAALLRIREMRAYVVLKKIGDAPVALLFRSAVVGGAFTPIAEEERKKIDEGTPVVVLEGEGPPEIDKEALSKRVAEVGLYELMLVAAAQELPYGAGSSLASIPVKAAREEILSLQARAVKMDCVKGRRPFFQIDHVFCSTITVEMAA